MALNWRKDAELDLNDNVMVVMKRSMEGGNQDHENDWLADNNVKGLDDASMYAQMMRKEKDAEKQKVS